LTVTLPGVLVVNSSPSWGGNEFWSVRLAQGLAEHGHPVRFVWSHQVVGDRVQAAGLDGRRIPLWNDLDAVGFLQLHHEMVGHRPQAVLLTRWREYLLGGLAARLARIPRTVMGLGLKILPADDLKRRLTFDLSDRILVNAPEIRDTLIERSWIQPGKVQVVVNGVDLDRFQPRAHGDRTAQGRRFREEHGIGPEAPFVLTIGNLTDQKDHANLLDACARMRNQVPDLRVMILGEGLRRGVLEQKRQELGLDDAVLMPGFVSDVLPALAAADAFVLSSDNEGMAWVLMEAAACGLPVVTTDVSGARHCVEHGRTGLVVPPRDPAALGSALVELLTDSVRLESFGQLARVLAEERLDVERMLRETADLLFSDVD